MADVEGGGLPPRDLGVVLELRAALDGANHQHREVVDAARRGLARGGLQQVGGDVEAELHFVTE